MEKNREMLEGLKNMLRNVFNIAEPVKERNMSADEMQSSSPIRILLKANGGSFSNIDFFDAVNNAGATNDGLPVKGAAYVSAETGTGVSYSQVLNMLLTSNYKIGKIVVSGKTSLMRVPLYITHYDIHGNSIGKTIVIDSNLFQKVTNQYEADVNFWLNGMTKIRFAGTLDSGQQILYEFYPTKTYEKSFIAGQKYGMESKLPESGEIQKKGEKPYSLINFNKTDIL